MSTNGKNLVAWLEKAAPASDDELAALVHDLAMDAMSRGKSVLASPQAFCAWETKCISSLRVGRETIWELTLSHGGVVRVILDPDATVPARIV